VNLEFVLSVIGCVLFVEGIPYFLSPGALKKVMLQVLRSDDRVLRQLGFVLMTAGLLTVAVARYLLP